MDAWKEFEHNVVPRDCPRAQRRTLMFAFYAASLTMADRLLAAADKDADLTAFVDAKRECQEMANAIAATYPR
jgi:hypothetical protein